MNRNDVKKIINEKKSIKAIAEELHVSIVTVYGVINGSIVSKRVAEYLESLTGLKISVIKKAWNNNKKLKILNLLWGRNGKKKCV